MDDVCSCDAVLRGLSLVYLARKLNVCHVSRHEPARNNDISA
jgi:hypothetical protein